MAANASRFYTVVTNRVQSGLNQQLIENSLALKFCLIPIKNPLIFFCPKGIGKPVVLFCRGVCLVRYRIGAVFTHVYLGVRIIFQ